MGKQRRVAAGSAAWFRFPTIFAAMLIASLAGAASLGAAMAAEGGASPAYRVKLTRDIHSLTELAVSADGKQLAVGTMGGGVQIWDWRHATMTVSLHPGGDFVQSLAFFDSGRRIIVSVANDDMGGDIFVADLASRESTLIGQLEQWIVAPVKGGAGIANGDRLSLLDSSGEYQGEDIVLGGYVASPAISPDGRLVAVFNHPELQFYDIETRALRSIDFRGRPDYHGTAFSPDGKTLGAVDDEADSFDLLDVAKGTRLHQLKGHKDFVSGGAFSPDGATVLTWGGDGTLILWDAVTGKQIRALAGHKGGVGGAVFLDGGRLIASCGSDGSVRIWSAARGDELVAMYALGDDGGTPSYIAMRPDGHFFEGGQVHLYIVPVVDGKEGESLRAEERKPLKLEAMEITD